MKSEAVTLEDDQGARLNEPPPSLFVISAIGSFITAVSQDLA